MRATASGAIARAMGLLAVALVALVTLAASPGHAEAARQAWTYCGYVFPGYPDSCRAVNSHGFDLNRATYPGSGSLYVCEGAWVDFLGYYGPQRCGWEYAGSGYDFQNTQGLQKRGYNMHGGGNPHTINGAMWTGWFS